MSTFASIFAKISMFQHKKPAEMPILEIDEQNLSILSILETVYNQAGRDKTRMKLILITSGAVDEMDKATKVVESFLKITGMIATYNKIRQAKEQMDTVEANLPALHG